MRLDVHSLVTDVLNGRRDPYREPQAGVDACTPGILRTQMVYSEGAASTHMPVRELTYDVLRQALRGGECRGAEDDVLIASVRRTCTTARDRGMKVESLIIMLKDAWHELPEARLAHRQEGTGTLSTVISLCIEEYYRGSRRE